MNITWELNKDVTVRNWQLCYQDVQKGFYQLHRFYVLPFLPKKFRDRVVFLPKQVDINIAEHYSKYLRQFHKRFTDLCCQSEQLFPRLEHYCKKHFSTTKLAIRILPTFVGVIGRYEVVNKELLLYPRFDRNIYEIYCLIITALVEIDLSMQNKKLSWKEKQHLTKDLFSSNSFRKLFPRIKDMTEILNENTSGELAVQSYRYLAGLGYPIRHLVHTITQIPTLTKSEKCFLHLLLDNRGKLASFRTLAVALWETKVTEKYSLYALSRIATRVREKFRKIGLRDDLIQAQRGKGHLLYD